MRVVNHREDNSYTISTSVMRGTIYMTREEFNEAYDRIKEINDNNGHDWSMSNMSLWKPLEDYVSILCIGVSNTQTLFDIYGLKWYKAQNYWIIIE